MVWTSVAEAAVVGRPDPAWVERPVAFVVLRPGHPQDTGALLDDVLARVPKWWLPDEVRYVDELPRNTTGKVAKDALRALAATA